MPETDVPQTDDPETDDPETDVPETEGVFFQAFTSDLRECD